MPPPQLTLLQDDRLPIMVVSHERSGTHFVMNTLTTCFDYVSDPWMDLDRHQFNINYYHPVILQELLLNVAAWKAANVLKSHHEFEFFSEIAASFEGSINIVYVFRDPADVMASFWRFLHTWQWVEGPKAKTAFSFATAPPMGRLMRFQYRQRDTMLDRWANHVQHWMEAASQFSNIHVVKYENLKFHFEDTVNALGTAIRLAPRRLVRPSRRLASVKAGDYDFAPAPGSDNRNAITDMAMTKYPELMAWLGYAQSTDRVESIERPPIMRRV